MARTFSPQKRRGKGRWILVLFALLVVLGVLGYFGAGVLGYPLPGLSTGNNGGGTQSPITTTALNSTASYAGVALTLLNAQQAQNFTDDPNTTTTGMVRLSLQEENKTAVQVNWLYSDIARLLLPNGVALSPTYVKAHTGIAPGAKQTSFVDFSVPSSTKISQLTLRLGTSNEAQMDIPLTENADLTKYQPKTTTLNRKMQYMGLDWMLTNATLQWSIDGQQASKGMRYLVVTLSVNNTLSQVAIPGSAYDYIQLQSGSTTAELKKTTLPVSFDPGVMGKTGTVVFLIPQDAISFTLLLLPQKQNGNDTASVDFQLTS